MLVAAMLGSLGFTVRFRAVFPRDDGTFSHVFCEVLRPGPEWVPIDPTAAYAPRWLWKERLRTGPGGKRLRGQYLGVKRQTITQPIN
jgi:hypothetical protein